MLELNQPQTVNKQVKIDFFQQNKPSFDQLATEPVTEDGNGREEIEEKPISFWRIYFELHFRMISLVGSLRAWKEEDALNSKMKA